MILDKKKKTPDDRLDYDIVFSRWLTGEDTIETATSEITGGTAIADEIDWDDETVKIWIVGGVAGETNKIVITANTADGRVKQIGFELLIREI